MIRTAKSIIRQIVRPKYHKIDICLNYSLFGDRNAPFPLITAEQNENSVIFSFGLGENISFEKSVIARFGCEIHGFDPTPKSIEWVKSQHLPDSFIVHRIGIGGQDTEATFYPPENDEYVSYSVSPALESDTEKAVVSKVMRLKSIMEMLKTPLPDVVRMNVEGFEYQAVEDIIDSGLRPKQLIVEFHHGMYGITPDRTMKAVALIRDAGYQIFYISDHGRDYGFFHHPS